MGSQLWAVIEEIVRAEGLELFDVEIPNGPTGPLRVYISRPRAAGEDAPGGVKLDDCAAISRKIIDLPTIEELLPGDHVIEVSSPGVNRKLSRAEHFRGAIGERVKLKFREASGINKTVCGKLTSASETALGLEDEDTQTALTIPLADVRQARVDFLFE